jgi:hypothetical protein
MRTRGMRDKKCNGGKTRDAMTKQEQEKGTTRTRIEDEKQQKGMRTMKLRTQRGT